MILSYPNDSNFISLTQTSYRLRIIVIILFFFPFFGIAQDYVDLLKIGVGQTFNNSFDGYNDETQVKLVELDFTLPLVINENNALVTGVSFSANSLELFPDLDDDGFEGPFYGPFDESTQLYSTTLKLGIATTFNDKWSATLVALPKIASDYSNIGGDDLYFGGYGVLKLKKRDNLIYRFGLYATTEAFGLFSTPIIGWYYLSPNQKFEMDMSLPIAADINYDLGFATIGMDYFGIGRSYNVAKEGFDKVYVDQSSLEFLGYLQFNLLQKSVLLRAKAGYASSNNDVYKDGDKIDFGLSAFSFGDNREQLNPDIGGGLLVKFEAVYRFHIKNKKEEIEIIND